MSEDQFSDELEFLDDIVAADNLTQDLKAPLLEIIRGIIQTNGGSISFKEFMDLALNYPDFGYYSKPDLKLGIDGDFETSPEVHPMYGGLWARQLLECWTLLGSPSIFTFIELGGGSGSFLLAMLASLKISSPDCANSLRLIMVDGSEHRLDQQREKIELAHPDLEGRIEFWLLDDWLGKQTPLEDSVLFANEFFDALPVHLLEASDEPESVVSELQIVLDERNQLAFQRSILTDQAVIAHLDQLFLSGDVPTRVPISGTRIEVSLAACELMNRVSAKIANGYMFISDYGYEALDLYSSWRKSGTLMAFRGHNVQQNVLDLPGITDLTSHVNFTALARAADPPWVSDELVSQAEVLVSLGAFGLLNSQSEWAQRRPDRFLVARKAIETLTDPNGLGRIRVRVMRRSVPVEKLLCQSEVLI